ncbi:MAG: carbohydrate binding family 9 domain-containing protein, partial [Bacteroidales bacterium]
IVLLAALSVFAFSNETRKKMVATRALVQPKIDGVLDDPGWTGIPVASDFIQFSPFNGSSASMRTEVMILYDNNALYIGAMLYDSNPDSIYRELGERDGDFDLNADKFSIDISPFDDGVNGVSFKVSASGVQSDEMRSPVSRRGSDPSWDAVWHSATSINNDGWAVEMKIPYSAIRFSGRENQKWGINFWREIRRYRETASWNYVDNEVGNTFTHLGLVEVNDEITPPFRLSLTPYLSGYIEKNPGGWGTSYNGGMDLKYGINESFTFDATLIPDFGQVQSDDQVLNLSPYEVRYNEKRQFFTEGTELFSKGGLFYSRRIGSKPGKYNKVANNLDSTEIIIENPDESRLINASKISGRTRSGLGIGIFNAVTGNEYASILDTETSETRKILTQPVTNYNLFVLDQSLRNNSYISLINTNVYRNDYRDEDNYTANVTGTAFELRSKSNLYSISGKASVSQKYYDSLDNSFGHAYSFRMGKTGGRFRTEYSQELMSDTYDINDMGYIRRANEFTNQLLISYNIFKPVWRIINSRNTISFRHSMLHTPREFTDLEIGASTFTTFRSYNFVRLNVEFRPLGSDDYFEPRISGWKYHRDKSMRISGWLSSDRRKPFFYRMELEYDKRFSDHDEHGYRFEFSPTVRVSNRFNVNLRMEYDRKNNNPGYVNNNGTDSIYFGIRNIKTISNTVSTNYIFTNRSYLSLRFRHYWSRADYKNEYFLLMKDGSLQPDDYSGYHNRNFNTFNIDMVYTWRFAPGSELSVVWKNSIYQSDTGGKDVIINGFFEDLKYTLASPQVNSISVKVLYYLDYQYLKRKT